MSIRISHVSKSYGAFRAVDDLSLDAPAGQVVAFLGPNGAGKTTTIKMVTGLLTPDAGTIEVCGHSMNHNGRQAKLMMAYVPDQPFLYEKLTASEFLRFVAEMYRIDPRVAQARTADLIERLDIARFADQLAEGYSHGMKQRVVLAAALLHDPQVLIVDEPMVGLDPRTVRTVKELFRERAAAGKTVFMSTHTLDMVESLADRIVILHRGKLVAGGTMVELKDLARRNRSLEDIFLELTDTDVSPGAAGD